MPSTYKDILHWLKSVQGGYGDLPIKCYAALEKVGGYVGGEGDPGSAMFKFGASWGSLGMACVALGIEMYVEPTPQTWQKAFGLVKSKGEKKGPWKNRLKAKAQALFPSDDVTLLTADALLIAEYCRRKQQGEL